MKALKLKINKLPALTSAVFSLLTLMFVSTTAVADTYPYFIVNGHDAFAGGWFDYGGGCTTNYQAPTYSSGGISPATSEYTGGILAFKKLQFDSGGNGGASGQFGAFALGLIEKNSPANPPYYGFSSNGSNGSSLSFANSSSLSGGIFAGGLFENASLPSSPKGPGSHCIPDYYGKKGGNPSGAPSPGSVNIGSLSSGKYNYQSPGGANIILPGAVIPAGVNLTVFVKGSVYIQSNITYAGNYSEAQVPKFALVVSGGSIYIDKAVTQLDGFYIAEPNQADALSADTGTIWTCHDNSQTKPDGVWVKANCSGAGLTFNGAVVAKQLYMFRVGGDVTTTPAETYNFRAENVLNGGFFSGGGGGNTDFGNIDSLKNLPPVF